MTVLEALKEMKNDLSAIPVKIGDMNTIGLPIHNAVQNLGAIIVALERDAERAEQNRQEQPAENAEPTEPNEQEAPAE